MAEEIDCKYTHETVCPYCGHENRDSWELGSPTVDSGETTCRKCEKDFLWSRDIEVTYSTRKNEESA